MMNVPGYLTLLIVKEPRHTLPTLLSDVSQGIVPVIGNIARLMLLLAICVCV
jgi:hypothetical protein